MEIEISSLDRAEVKTAGRLLARAFAEDPILTHYLHDPVRRAVALPAFFQAVLEELMPSGQVFAARSGDDLLGIAAWLPPDPALPDEAAVERGNGSRQIVERLFPATSGDLYAGFAELERLHPHEPHWYLAFIGIEPAAQGQGIGKELLAPVLRAADETRTISYLETPFPRTHRFYERLGFSRHSELNPFPGAPEGVVAFVRSPAGVEASEGRGL